MRFHSRDQVQNLGLPDLPMYPRELTKFADNRNNWSKAWQILPGTASEESGKLMLVNATGPIHKLTILGGVGIMVSPFGGNRES
jgi:hypothetical protein